MNTIIKPGDVLIVGGYPMMIINYRGILKDFKDKKYNYCLYNLKLHDLDYFMEEIEDFKIGDIIFSCGDDTSERNMKLEMIIPAENVNISFGL